MSPATTNPIRVRVPTPFASVLLDELRDPFGDDDERDSIIDPEQIEYEANLDAFIRGLVEQLEQLDGVGDRVVIVPSSGSTREWLGEYVGELVLEDMTARLCKGSTVEREATVAALAGWVDFMAQLDRVEAVSTGPDR